MLQKKALKLLLILPAVLLCAGCWDAVDINDREIVTGVCVDKTDYGYAFYIEVPSMISESKDSGVSGGTKPTILKAEGRNYSETRRESERMTEKPIFLGAVQTVLLTDKLAAYDIEEYVLRLRQLNDYRKTVHVIVTTEEPMKLLTDKPENAPSVGVAIDQTLESLDKSGQIHHVSLMDVLEELASPYRHFDLPTIALVNEEPTFTGFTLFSGGIKTGFIPSAESRPIIFMRSNNARFDYTIPYRETRVSITLQKDSKKVKSSYLNGNIRFQLYTAFKAELIYPEKEKPLTDEDFAIIKATLTAAIEKEITGMYRKSQQEYHYDCFQLHEPFRIAHPEEYKRMNWADEYDKAALELTVNVKLTPTDMIDYNPKEQ